MIRLRKWTILIHRYLGIATGALFVVWFLSGIGMMYAGGMPRLTPALRLERMPAMDFPRVRLSLAEAAARAELRGTPRRAWLLTVFGRPAYRFSDYRTITVFADTGEPLEDLDAAAAVEVAARFLGVPASSLGQPREIEQPDQWTIGLRRQLPLYKITANDAARSDVYVSGGLAEVVLYTTRGSRALAWVAAIPHWLYFTPLRLNDRLWQRVILWTSGIGIVVALAGLALAWTQLSPSRPFRWNRLGSYVPYSGLMRWHYVTGVIFGIFTFTWVLSGFLSLSPGDWASTEGVGGGIREALAGGPLDVSLFPALSGDGWNRVPFVKGAKEIEFARYQGAPHLVVRRDAGAPELVDATTLEPRRAPFSLDSVLSRVRQGVPEASMAETAVLTAPDAYYRGRRDTMPPLPAVRVKFDDPDGTWFYIDQMTSQPIARFTRRQRVERWVYHGFHSLDFAFWYSRRPLWDIGVIVLSLGGAASSAIGLWLGLKRLGRTFRRRRAAARPLPAR